MVRTEETAVPDVLLERYRLGELPEPERAQIAARLTTDPHLVMRLEALERSDREIAERHPAQEIASDVRRRATQNSAPARRMRLAGWLVLGASAVAIVVVAILAGPERDDRIKGLSPSLTVYRQTTHGSERLNDDTLAHTGDVLRLGYVAAGARFGVIVSMDGRQVVTVHLPSKDDRAASLASGGQVLLDQAYELDDAPVVERFYFVTGASPFPVASVIDAAKRAAAEHAGAPATRLALPKELDQYTIAVRKD